MAKPQYNYVDVTLIGPEVEEIFAILMQAGIAPAAKHDLHATVIYDERKDMEAPLAELDPSKVFHANIVSLEVLGDGLVFHLTSRELLEEHMRLKECGYIHSFDGFMPHMSLTYNFNQYDILTLRSLFAMWGGRQLTFSRQGFGTKL